MAALRLEDLHKTYPGGHVAVVGVDLAIPDGELLVLVGPSGCGKSTTLRLVAGLESPSRGRLLLGERDVTHLSPQERDLAMVFQNYALYPHKTVAENLAFGLRMRRVPRAEIDRRVGETAARLGLEALLGRKPASLSGGQRQRVALGRAIVREPQAFLLDEPLSNLDARLRAQTRAELARLHRQLGTTMLYVTHDQEEAMTLGDRIAVMNEGRLEQVAPPLEVYRRPATRFVAGFVGSPAMNLLEVEAEPSEGRWRLRRAGLTLEAPAEVVPGGGRLHLGVRPHDLRITSPESGALRARVDVVEPLGSTVLLHLDAGPELPSLRAVVPPEAPPTVGDVVGLAFPSTHLHLFAPNGERLGRIRGGGGR